MGKREAIFLKRIFAFFAALNMLLVVTLFTNNNKINIAAASISEVSNERRLAVEHKTEGSIDKEVQTALETAAIDSKNVQLLVISGSTKLNNVDWSALKNRVGLSSLTHLYFDGYSAEDSIPEKALYGADWLVNLKLSSSIKKIGISAFENCNKLANVILDGVVTIGDRAFASSTLTNIDMPEVTSIGGSAFNSCTRLKEINADKLETIGASAFYNCPALTQISLPKVHTLEKSAFESCGGLNNVSAPSLSKIGENAFAKATNLKQIIMGNNPQIGTDAFLNASSQIFVMHEGTAPNLASFPNKSTLLQYTGNVAMPKSQYVAEGASIGFSVELTPSSTSTVKIARYQWYKDGRTIPDATHATMGVGNVRVADEAKYQVRIEFDASALNLPTNETFPTFTSIPATLAIEKKSLQAISGLPAKFQMEVNDKVLWDPTPREGTWTYERAGFELSTKSNGYEFTALKDGKYTITYTAPNQNSHRIAVEVGKDYWTSSGSTSKSTSNKEGSGGVSGDGAKPSIPGTGQGVIYVLMAAGAVIAVSAGLLVAFRKEDKISFKP